MSQVCLLYLFVQFSSSRFRFTTEIVKVQNTVGLQKKMWIEKNVLKQSECIECLICVVVAIGFDGLYCPLSFCSSLLQPACPQCCRGRYLVVCAWGPFMLLWLSSLCSVSLFNTCSGRLISAVPLTLFLCHSLAFVLL